MTDTVTTDAVLELTTEVLPAKKMLIDGTEYDLLNFDHLSPEEEASVTAMFARFQKIYRLLEKSSNDQKATVEAKKLTGYREKLILKMTTIPLEVLRELGAAKQGKILAAIQEEISAEVDDEDDGDGDDEE